MYIVQFINNGEINNKFINLSLGGPVVPLEKGRMAISFFVSTLGSTKKNHKDNMLKKIFFYSKCLCVSDHSSD